MSEGTESARPGPIQDRGLIHREMVRRSPNPVFLVEAASGRILEANPAAADLLGCPLAELATLEFHRVDARGAEAVERLVNQVTERHHDIFGETEFLRRDGQLVPVELSGNLLIVDEREVVCFFARDVSDRRAAEDDRYRLERQLWYSQKHEAVGRLAGGIAHDFNNLLQAIMLNVDLVKDQLPPDHPVLDEVDEIGEASRRARDLTKQLLAFSGRQILRPAAVRLNQVVTEMERIVRRTIGEDIVLEVELSEDAGVVHVDAGQIGQVLLNLVVNARDAMPEGGFLEIGTSNVELDAAFCRANPGAQPGPYVVLTVKDTGMGMDPDNLPRIFEPFYTTKAQGAGTGLGLATVYGIVKQSGGNIWAKSQLGEGTVFEVYLPRRMGVEPALSGLPDRVQELDSFRGTETVLVVEDEAAVRKLVAAILEGKGYSVLEAEGPDAALELYDRIRASEGTPNIVVTDVVMPGMTGPKMVERMRSSGLEAPVLFMSGYLGGVRPRDGDSFIPKPFSRLQLVREVRRILDAVP